MGRLKEWLLVKEENARLAELRKQEKAARALARANAKAKRAADKAAHDAEMALRAERRKNASSLSELIDLGREFGYRSPETWAKRVWEGRMKMLSRR
jgi:membrane protein involved in colicin uptake